MGTLQNKAAADAGNGIFSQEFSHLKWVEIFPLQVPLILQHKCYGGTYSEYIRHCQYQEKSKQ